MMLEGALFWLALNVYHEARGEDAVAQRAVAHVTLNRARERGHMNIRQVVLEPAQFSWTLDKGKLRTRPWETNPDGFLKCSINAVRALSGTDITKGATHYHESAMRPAPAWTRDMTVTLKYGPFTFYKEIDG